MRIEIIIPITDLTREFFSFSINGFKIVLEEYSNQYRKSKSSKVWYATNGASYNRIYHRESKIKLTDVPLTDDIKTKAINQFVKELKVVTEW
jgi:hypothetical protein